EMDGDATLLEQARAGIRALNARHGATDEERFYLFHRRRLWNPAANKWMGWERKRGKLLELNRLLRGSRDTSYIDIGPSASRPAHIRFVITLDADTRLPHGAGRRLIRNT